MGYRPEDINDFLENIIFLELLKRGYTVMVRKFGDYEIDFVCEKGNERIYIQVCYILTDTKVLERETRALLKIEDNYPKYLLTMDVLPKDNYRGIIRQYIPDFLMKKT